MPSEQSAIENLLNEAQALERQSRYEAAAEKLKRVLEISESSTNIKRQVSTLTKLGEIYQQISREQYERALNILARSQQLPTTDDEGDDGSSGTPLPLDTDPAEPTGNSGRVASRSSLLDGTDDQGKGSLGTPPPPDEK